VGEEVIEDKTKPFSYSVITTCKTEIFILKEKHFKSLPWKVREEMKKIANLRRDFIKQKIEHQFESLK
jgi:hypothetical protein